MTPCVVFDLDDTLYYESSYVESGFRVVARRIAEAGGPDEAWVFTRLHGMFEAGVRGNTFDVILRELPEVRERLNVRDLVEAYRSHTPDIRLMPGMAGLLDRLRDAEVPLALITDGFVVSQEAKLAALGITPLFDEIVISDGLGREHRKPHPLPYTTIERATADERPMGWTYVADNPLKDFITPRRRGWGTIRLRVPGQLRHKIEAPSKDHEPARVVESIKELGELLEVQCGYA